MGCETTSRMLVANEGLEGFSTKSTGFRIPKCINNLEE